jgi:chromosome partitioning protein
MTAHSANCSVCGVAFELHFRYQIEERIETSSDGSSETHTRHFCSQRCLEASHHGRADGQASCDACARRFSVEYAAQVLFTGGRRHYACSALCRSRVLEGVRAVRLGQILDPGYPLADEPTTGEPPLVADMTPLTPPPPLVLPSSARATPPPPAVAPSAAARSNRPAQAVPTMVAPRPAPSAASSASRSQAPRVLAVFNHKGGTGKTTTSVSVAAGLAARGQRVLLVDSDGQGNVATSLGLKFERSLYHVIVMGLDYREVAVEARDRLSVVPANETLAAAELYIAGQQRRDRLLASRFVNARNDFDYVIVDCSPSLSLMNQNALVMADAVLCPVACDYLSLVGVQKVVRTLKQVNRLLSHQLTFWGVLPTFFDTRARICHEALDTLRSHFREVCLGPIRLASRVKEAPSQGKTLFEYAPGSSAAIDYLAVVDKLLSGETTAQNAPATTLEGVA